MMRLTHSFDEVQPDATLPAAWRQRNQQKLVAGRVEGDAPRPAAGRAFVAESDTIKLPPPASDAWPAELDLIFSAMAAGGAGWLDQRRSQRTIYHVRAELSLFSQGPLGPSCALFCRDVDAKGIGFLTAAPLPLGYGGWVSLLAPNGVSVRVQCTILRCRPAIAGWHEGAVRFHERQAALEHCE